MMEVVDEVGDGLVGLVEEPLDGLAGFVVPQHVLKIEEFPSYLERQSHPSIPNPLRRANLAVPVLLPGSPPRDHAQAPPQPRLRDLRRRCDHHCLLIVMALGEYLVQGGFVFVEERGREVEVERWIIDGVGGRVWGER